jgi:cytochrome c-type biogenesis protein CcmH/NrfG
MPIPWLAVLQSVPWNQVISNAPKVAEGAKKLWNTVSGRPPAATHPVEHPVSPDAESIATFQQRLAAMEIAIDELHEQMLASTELIKSLAEQNTQLIKRIEDNRIRTGWLTAAVLGFGIVAVLSLGLVLAR